MTWMKPLIMDRIMHKQIQVFLIVFSLLILAIAGQSLADDFEFNKMDASFKNFVRCELTRTGAENHFNGKPFEITMINMFDIQEETGLKIVTGAVKCFVETQTQTLFIAVGLKSVVGKVQPAYYLVRDKDFSILATQLIQYPYKERCPWAQYWIDLD